MLFKIAMLEEDESEVFGSDSSNDPDGPRQKRKRHVSPRQLYEASSYGTMLREESLRQPDSRTAAKFRRRFRVPYDFFVNMLKL